MFEGIVQSKLCLKVDFKSFYLKKNRFVVQL